jgi:hypothetical protein
MQGIIRFFYYILNISYELTDNRTEVFNEGCG